MYIKAQFKNRNSNIIKNTEDILSEISSMYPEKLYPNQSGYMTRSEIILFTIYGIAMQLNNKTKSPTYEYTLDELVEYTYSEKGKEFKNDSTEYDYDCIIYFLKKYKIQTWY